MNLRSPYLKKKFTSRPSVCSECGWPYNLEVQYKKGTLRHIADALSRAYLKTTGGAQIEFCEIRALETVDHEEHILIEPPKRDVFSEQIAAHGDIQELNLVIKLGWPDKKK